MYLQILLNFMINKLIYIYIYMNYILNYFVNNLEKIIIGLIIFWIIISIIKKNMNKDGIYRYKFIQRNTIMYWIWICISLFLSKKYFKNYWFSIGIFIIIFIIHEILWYVFHITILIDEGEKTSNFYNNANIYLETIKDLDLNGTDLTEGLFNKNWNLTNNQALNLKYETYYKYLKLEPGMKLLDIGSGNCLWLNFCKKKGIDCTGITISESQKKFCENNNINIILGNINNDVLLNINKKFDAITNIGALEHFVSFSQPKNKRKEILNKYYTQVKNLIKKNSKSGRYLNSYMTNNENYSKYHSFKWFVNVYLLASVFGYGYYSSPKRTEKIYNSKNSQIILKTDYTEDYRWILVRDKNTWGWLNYKINTPKRLFYTIVNILTNPFWLHFFLYGYSNSWLWQFGGTQQTPMPENKDTPIRSYIYVTKITK